MQNVWIQVECLKCGGSAQRKYIITTVDEFQKLLTLQCTCSNTDHTSLRLQSMHLEDVTPL